MYSWCYRTLHLTSPQYNVLLLGGLAGRLDQTAHTMSYLLKQRQKRPYLMAITEESLAWVLDAVRVFLSTISAGLLMHYWPITP